MRITTTTTANSHNNNNGDIVIAIIISSCSVVHCSFFLGSNTGGNTDFRRTFFLEPQYFSPPLLALSAIFKMTGFLLELFYFKPVLCNYSVFGFNKRHCFKGK